MPINADFLDMAKRECKGMATNEEVDFLMHEDNRFAWCQALITAISDYDSQMIFHKTRIDMLGRDAELGVVSHHQYYEEKQRFDEWIRKSTRYRNGLNQRLSEVKSLLANKDTLEHIEEIARLTRAIIEHRRVSTEGKYMAEAHDIKLWSQIVEQ